MMFFNWALRNGLGSGKRLAPTPTFATENFRMSITSAPGAFPIVVQAQLDAQTQVGDTVTVTRSPTFSPWSPVQLASFPLTAGMISGGSFSGALNIPGSGAGIYALSVGTRKSDLAGYGTPVAAALTTPTTLSSYDGIYSVTHTFNQPGRLIDVVGRDGFLLSCDGQTGTSFTVTRTDGAPLTLTNLAQYQPGSIGVLKYTLIFETLQGVRSRHTITDTIQAVTVAPFSFSNVNNAAYSTPYRRSVPISTTPPGRTVTASLTAGLYSLNGTDFFAAAGLTSLSDGNTLTVELTSAATDNQQTSATLTAATRSAIFTVATPSTYDTDAQALFARFTVDPGNTRKTLYNDLILALKSAGVWSKLDVLYIFAAHNSQASLLNVRSSAYDANTTGATGVPTFVTDRHWTNSGGVNTIFSGFFASTAGGQFTQNSAHYGAYSRLDAINITNIGGNSNTQMVPRSSNANTLRGRVNGAGNNNYGATTNSLGHFMFSRTGATSVTAYQNGSSVGTSSDTSQALSTAEMILSPNTHLIGAWHWGAGLTSTEAAALYTAIQNYMTGVGANV